MARLIVLMLSLIVTLLSTVAEASVYNSDVIKGPQIEALCVDIGFDQVSIEYRALFYTPNSFGVATVKRPFTAFVRVEAEQKAKNVNKYLKKAGTERYNSPSSTRYYKDADLFNANRIRDGN